jgi:hypothetical protein
MAMVSIEASGLRAQAIVKTDSPSPYLKQLAKHFRQKLDVSLGDQEAVIPFAFGHAQLRAGDGELHASALAPTPADLRRVEQVVGSHLERFGRRDELVIRWTEEDRYAPKPCPGIATASSASAGTIPRASQGN